MFAPAVVTGLLFLVSGVEAAQLATPNASGSRGSTVMVSVSLVSGGASISGVQFDIDWDASAMMIAPLPGKGVAAAGKQFYSAALGPHQSRYVIVGLNQTILPDDELVSLFVVVKPNAKPGAYKLALSHIIATTPDGHAVPIGGTIPKFTVQQ